jgi:hypothetical protein
MGMKINVKNVEGHFENPPQGSWIAYWEEKTGKKANECNDVTCHEANDLVGGHVLKVPFDGKVYLTPLCKGRNDWHKTDVYEIDGENLFPVPFEDLKMVPGFGTLEAWLKAINLMMKE